MGKGHSPEQIVRKLRQAEAQLASGVTVPEVCRELGISEATFHRWRNRYGGMSSLRRPNDCGSWRRRTPASRRLSPSRLWTSTS